MSLFSVSPLLSPLSFMPTSRVRAHSALPFPLRLPPAQFRCLATISHHQDLCSSLNHSCWYHSPYTSSPDARFYFLRELGPSKGRHTCISVCTSIRSGTGVAEGAKLRSKGRRSGRLLSSGSLSSALQPSGSTAIMQEGGEKTPARHHRL